MNLKVKNLELISRLLAPETCLELANSGMTESIDIMLDPDGKNQGLPPIQVKCQLPEGKSIVGEEVTAKGQLISKCPFGVFKSSKKPTKFFPGFLPLPLKRGQIKKAV